MGEQEGCGVEPAGRSGGCISRVRIAPDRVRLRCAVSADNIECDVPPERVCAGDVAAGTGRLGEADERLRVAQREDAQLQLGREQLESCEGAVAIACWLVSVHSSSWRARRRSVQICGGVALNFAAPRGRANRLAYVTGFTVKSRARCTRWTTAFVQESLYH